MNALPMVIMIALAAVMMYFMSRRQKRAVQTQQDLQNSLSVGDRVMTTSGLYGTVVSTSDDATIDIEIAPGVTTNWLRGAIREKVGPDVPEVIPEPEALDEDEVVEVEKADDTESLEQAKKSR